MAALFAANVATASIIELELSTHSSDVTDPSVLLATFEFEVDETMLTLTVTNGTFAPNEYDMRELYFNLGDDMALTPLVLPAGWGMTTDQMVDGFGIFDIGLDDGGGLDPSPFAIDPGQTKVFTFTITGTGTVKDITAATSTGGFLIAGKFVAGPGDDSAFGATFIPAPTTALTVLFTEFYYWVMIVLMFLIKVGFCVYEVSVSRYKNRLHTLMQVTMHIPLVTLGFFLFGWWIYFAFANGPGITGGLISAPWAVPWSELMGPHLGGPPASDALTADDTALWARLNGVFWGAFLLFSWTVAAIVSSATIERIRSNAFWILAVLIGCFLWIIDASWGWSPDGWMVQKLGYHDACRDPGRGQETAGASTRCPESLDHFTGVNL